jgi:dDENN domain
VNEIRNAFFSFFVSLFQNYKSYMDIDNNDNNSSNKFRSTDFIIHGIHHGTSTSNNALEFVESIISTQMFEAFLEDRRCCPDDPEVLFFDESITAKHNRSKKQALTNISMGRAMKQSTDFLDDTNHLVRLHIVICILFNNTFSIMCSDFIF